MAMVVVFDSVTILQLLSMAVSIKYQQNKDNQTPDEQNNDARPVSPQLGYETPKIQTHGQLYTRREMSARFELASA
jgi:hypothetical protein